MIERISRYSLAALLAALSLAALAGPAGAAVPAGNTGWNWSSPTPQGNSLYAIAASGGRVWAGGANGTLMYSGDNGATWTAARTGLLDDIRIVEPISPNSVVFAASCALRRTDDGGVTVRRLAWSVSDDSCPAKIQAVSFTAPLIGYLLLSNGDVYATGDGGDSWHKQGVVPGSSAGGGDAVYDMKFQSATGVVSVGNKIMQSVDAGAHWTPVKTADTGDGKFHFAFPTQNVGYAAGLAGNILKTIDGGATWTSAASGVHPYDDFIAVDCGDDSHCAAVTPTGATSWTGDGGATWESPTGSWANDLAFVDANNVVSVGADGMIQSSSTGGFGWNYRLGFGAFGVEDFRSAVKGSALLIDGGGVSRSTDGGAVWTRLFDASNGPSVYDAAMPTTKRVLVLANFGLERSTDGGKTWKYLHFGGVDPMSEMVAFADGSVIITKSKGVLVSHKWGAGIKAARGFIAHTSLLSADQAGKAAFVYGRRAIAITTNRGRSWRRVKRPPAAATIYQLDMVDSKHGYLLDGNSELFYTSTGGRRWKRLETTGANQAFSMFFGDRKHGYITDYTGRVLATSDGGATWSRQYPFYDASSKSPMIGIGLSKSRAVMAVRNSSKVFSTRTGGRIGKPSVLTIKPSATKVRSGAIVPVTGKLTPATGVERVAVLARVTSAKGGTQWVTQNVTVSATGTFTTKWKITASTEFIARWSGDAAHDGDAAPLKVVKLRK